MKVSTKRAPMHELHVSNLLTDTSLAAAVSAMAS
jgi:hypothetical protein